MDVIDGTYFDFVALINNAFYPQKGPSEFRLALFAWLHYEARRIPRRPRKVIKSNQVKANEGKYPAINKIEAELEKGGDLSPWLHDPIRTRKADPKADMMFNDWQVNHLHLGDVFVKPNKAQRTGDLLFAYVTPERAVLLDVKPHGSWAMVDLLRTLLRLSPEDMEPYKAQGAVGLQRRLTDREILNCRSNGYNAFVEIDGSVYMAPGMGIMSSKHGTRFVRYADQLLRSKEKMLDELRRGNVPVEWVQAFSRNPHLPVKLGVRMQSGAVIIHDKNRNLDLVPMKCVA